MNVDALARQELTEPVAVEPEPAAHDERALARDDARSCLEARHLLRADCDRRHSMDGLGWWRRGGGEHPLIRWGGGNIGGLH